MLRYFYGKRFGSKIWNRQSVPKRWHIKFRRRRITQNIQHSEYGESLKSRKIPTLFQRGSNSRDLQNAVVERVRQEPRVWPGITSINFKLLIC